MANKKTVTEPLVTISTLKETERDVFFKHFRELISSFTKNEPVVRGEYMGGASYHLVSVEVLTVVNETSFVYFPETLTNAPDYIEASYATGVVRAQSIVTETMFKLHVTL